MDRKFITVRYSCPVCGLVDKTARVRARGKEEDIIYYMEKVVAQAIQDAHQLASFGCEAVNISNLKIPLPPENDPDPWIGKFVEYIPPEGT